MSLVSITSIKLLNNPSPINASFDFTISFDCYEPLVREDVMFRFTYVSSPEDGARDHVLNEVMVGPLDLGANFTKLTIPAPDIDSIPLIDRYQHHAIKIACSYRDHVFARYGFYVFHEMPPAEPTLRTRWINAYTEELESDVKSLTDMGDIFLRVQQLTNQSNAQQLVPRNAHPNRVWRITTNYPITTKYTIQWDEETERYEQDLEAEVKEECKELTDIVQGQLEEYKNAVAAELEEHKQAVIAVEESQQGETNEETEDEVTEDESENESDPSDGEYDIGSDDTDEEEQMRARKRART